ncbi:L-PSP endoribonuclease family protein [Cladophialophora carrionii]|uniref:L-PSP endoribonuclease family protein n=1 Tax=Cladophialophora carrionii TaxID=86049 RepID=A0A1C1CIH1_9EURO|nr:L-PSP endoribonuclease family protein [Cladophialophora carrionii]
MSQLINPADVRTPPSIYSHVQVTPISPTSSLVTIAGQIGVPPNSAAAASTFAEQVEIALDNLRKCLAAVGATPADIIKVTHYVVNLDPKDKSRLEAYTKFIGDHRPPATLVGVAALAWPDLLYEVEAMAIVQQK